MTPQEKSKELFNKFCYTIRTEETDSGYFTNVLYAKQCALIAVDEILNTIWEYHLEAEFWQEVKHEIEKL